MKKLTLLFAPTYLYRDMAHVEPPLGISYLAQPLKEKFDVTAINSNSSIKRIEDERSILKKIVQEVEKTSPDFLAISSWTYGMPFTAEFSEEFKKRNPDAPIILGGHNATLMPNETLGLLKNVDFLVRGEGNKTILELINALSAHKKANNIKGISFRRKKTIVNNPNREIIRNIDKLPLLDFSYFKEKMNKFYLMTSFGCPYSCSFCSDRLFWGNFRQFSADYMIKQIKLIKKLYGDVQIDFWDSGFTANKEWGLKFCRKLTKEKMDLRWFCYSRIDNMNEEIAAAMKKAGCSYVFFGVESLHPKTLAFYNKTNDVNGYIKKIPKTIDILNKLNMETILSFIIGAPTENKKELFKNLSLMEGLKKDFDNLTFELSQLTPEIGSPLWSKFLADELKLFKIKNKKISKGYAGLQLFADKYSNLPWMAPQEYLFENKHLKNEEFEKILDSILTQFRKKKLNY